jgi:superfamily II RNA helicase
MYPRASLRALRCIDENKSMLVCAPTSSGKTVISSYVASMWMQSSSSR